MVLEIVAHCNLCNAPIYGEPKTPCPGTGKLVSVYRSCLCYDLMCERYRADIERDRLVCEQIKVETNLKRRPSFNSPSEAGKP